MAYLIIGGKKEQREEKIKEIAGKEEINLENNFDLLIIETEKRIGIEQIRQIKKFLSKKSWQGKNKKAIIVPEAQTMTPEAQNAFLKTLEEPPANSIIILAAQEKSSLLPTIISRCQITKVRNRKEKDHQDSWQKWQEIIDASLEKKLTLLEPSDLEKQINGFITSLQAQLIKEEGDANQISSWIKLLNRAQKMLFSNINPQRVIDWIALQL